jgi:hypothetical protein
VPEKNKLIEFHNTGVDDDLWDFELSKASRLFSELTDVEKSYLFD